MSHKPSRKQDVVLILFCVLSITLLALLLYLFPITIVSRSEWLGTIPAR